MKDFCFNGIDDSDLPQTLSAKDFTGNISVNKDNGNSTLQEFLFQSPYNNDTAYVRFDVDTQDGNSTAGFKFPQMCIGMDSPDSNSSPSSKIELPDLELIQR